MYDKEFKELVKIAVEKLKDESVLKLLQADASYQKDSKDEGYAEDAFNQLDLTQEQREVCQHLIDCREKQDFEYGTHAYIAGLMDAFHIMAVLFPEKWDTERVKYPAASYGACLSFSLACPPQGAGYLTRAQSPSASKLAFGSLRTRE